MKWRPSELDAYAPPKSKTRLSRRKGTLPPGQPNGRRGGSVSAKKAADRCRGGSADDQNRPSTVPPEQHLQVPGTGVPAGGGERSAPQEGAVASEPPDWRALGYPPASPTREQVIAALERRAEERGRSRRPTPGHHVGQPREQAITDGSQ
jgi:hypothetical protein